MNWLGACMRFAQTYEEPMSIERNRRAARRPRRRRRRARGAAPPPLIIIMAGHHGHGVGRHRGTAGLGGVRCCCDGRWRRPQQLDAAADAAAFGAGYASPLSPPPAMPPPAASDLFSLLSTATNPRPVGACSSGGTGGAAPASTRGTSSARG